MIVKKLESPVYYRKKREALPGRGVEYSHGSEKTFEEYLLEAFNGKKVQEGNRFSNDLSQMTKENLIRLSNF